MAHVGQRIVYRFATSDYRTARVSKIVSGTNVHLVAFGDPSAPATLFDGPSGNGIVQGTGVGQWQEDASVDPAIATAMAAEATARDAAIEDAVDERCAVPVAGSAPSLALNTARQPNATRPVRVTVSGTWSWSLTAIGSLAGVATFQSDSASTPTTARLDASCAREISVGVVVGDAGSMPWSMSYDVPAGHYYRIATSGSGSFAITRITEQVL